MLSDSQLRALDGTPDVSRVSPADQWQLAPFIAGAPVMRIGHWSDGRFKYSSRPQKLTLARPAAVAAVHLYDEAGLCSTLALDLDVGRAGHDGREAVERDYQAITGLLDELGVVWVGSVSPVGGRHIYVPLTRRLALEQASALVRAFAAQHATLDTSPHLNVKTGCIRVPGSAHKRGGHQELLSPFNRAYGALRTRNSAAVIAALMDRLGVTTGPAAAPSARSSTPATPAQTGSASWGRTAPVPGRGGTRRPLSARMHLAATTGQTDRAYPSPSEQRQAVMTAAARAGWAFADVAAHIEGGLWAWMAEQYQTRYAPAERRAAVVWEWNKAQAFIARPSIEEQAAEVGMPAVQKTNTSPAKSRRGQEVTGKPEARAWWTTLRAVETTALRDLPLLARMVLRALGVAAMLTGATTTAFGVRSIAVAVGRDHTVVADMLNALAGQPDPWLVRVAVASGRDADQYQLRIPTRFDSVRSTRSARRGLIHALRPAFRAPTLGVGAALVFEAIEDGATSRLTAADAVGMSRATVAKYVNELIAVGLVDVERGGLVARPGRLAQVAVDLDVMDDMHAQIARYRRHRTLWHQWLGRFEQDDASPDVSAEEAVFAWMEPPDAWMRDLIPVAAPAWTDAASRA